MRAEGAQEQDTLRVPKKFRFPNILLQLIKTSFAGWALVAWAIWAYLALEKLTI